MRHSTKTIYNLAISLTAGLIIAIGFSGCDTPATGNLETSSDSVDSATLQDESQYSYAALGKPGLYQRVRAINNEGQVVGTNNYAGMPARAFRWDGTNYETVGESICGGLTCESLAEDINNNGQIVGISGNAFLWEDSTTTQLGSLGGEFTWALSVNDQSQVVGYGKTPDGLDHAFLWENGQILDLGTLCVNNEIESLATDINNQGQAVGWSETTNGNVHLFLWEGGKMKDLGIKISRQRAIDINDQGQIIAQTGENNTSLLWENGEVRELEFEVIAINNGGQVLGRTPVERDYLIWEEGSITDISFSPDISDFENEENVRFTALNDSGQLAGLLTATDPSIDCGDNPDSVCSEEREIAFILNKYAE